MELTYPMAIYIVIGAILLILLLTFKRNKPAFKDGKRSANTEYVKSLPQYKLLSLEFGVLKTLAVIALIVALLMSALLISRPSEVKTTTQELHNRDIFICMDISTSLDTVSVEMCEQMEEFVSQLKGERFGITIFNGKAVLLVPLTNDYNYVLAELDRLKKSIEAGYDIWFYSDLDALSGYRFAGTDSERGSSLIGDGLASCLYSFTDLDEEPDRSRLIVFVTDNDLAGDPLVTIEEAMGLCAAHNVKVFSLAPYFVVNEDGFKEATESTGGEYFNTRNKNAIDDMLELVQKTDVSATYTTITAEVDVPKVPTVMLVISLLVYALCVRRIKV